ncbi:MAG: hypothetical protein QXW19_01855 [Candidatus Bathyarchaeia archaeon]
MADAPVLIPLLVLGALIGFLLRGTGAKIGWRFVALGSILGGLGNLAHGAVLMLTRGRMAAESVTRIPAIRQVVAIDPPPLFLALCFLTGSLMVLFVFASAILMLRIWRGRGLEE